MIELLFRVVPLPISEFDIRLLGKRELDSTKLSILRGIRRIVANDVIVRNGLLRLHNAAGEIV